MTNLRTLGKAAVADALVGEAGVAILAVKTAPNLIELEPQKFAAYVKAEGFEDLVRGRGNASGKPVRERYSKFAKALLCSQRIELPTSPCARLYAGDHPFEGSVPVGW